MKNLIKRELIGFCKYWLLLISVIVLFCCISCDANDQVTIFRQDTVKVHDDKILTDNSYKGNLELSKAAISIIDGSIIYDGSYKKINYPMGDVPETMGVCTDVIIRAYRKLNIDLQELIIKDMLSHPEYYNEKADRYISHRRVPNMMDFFDRYADKKIKGMNNKYYSPGDLVTWKIGISNHIGIVVDSIGPSGNYMVVHNIGSGQNMDDCLLDWTVTGHWSYDGPNLLDKDKIKSKR